MELRSVILQLPSRSFPRPWQSQLLRRACKAHLISRAFSQHPRRYYFAYKADTSQLAEPKKSRYFRPIFAKERTTQRPGNPPRSQYNAREVNLVRSNLVDGGNDFALYRLSDSGFDATDYAESEWRTRYHDPKDPIFSNVEFFRTACLGSFAQPTPVHREVQARKLCAQLKDPRHPEIYHSLEEQAHLLYLVGRTELERTNLPQWRGFACHMLAIGAELGQLDAALLLHQLEKVDSQRFVQPEQRAIIAKAASTQTDWRAMVAHSEYLVSTTRGRGGRGSSNKSDLAYSVQLLVDAMSLTGPLAHAQVQRQKPLEGFIDVDTLEQFDPPYKVLLNLIDSTKPLEELTGDLLGSFKLAAKIGALDYRDPKAAWQYVQCQRLPGSAPDDEWYGCLEFAASSGNADACYKLAMYHIAKDGWRPCVTEVVLDEIDRQWYEDWEMADDDEPEPIRVTEEQREERILARKDDKLLAACDGIMWMTVAARLQIDSPIKMLNRYSIAAGLLRQNGHLDQGLEVLREAQNELQHCAGSSRERTQALRQLGDYIKMWKSKKVHHLLPPRDINPLFV